MSEFQRKNLVYEKEDLLVNGEGKYLGYDFYALAGARPRTAEGRSAPVDPRSILP
jgi:NADH-quinone oxidoreductase subunit I